MWIAAAVLATTVVSGDLGGRLDGWLQASGFKGNVLVANKGEIVLRKGYALSDRERGVPFSPESVFSIGSVTKQFTAAAILKLEMQGKLKVEDPIAKYLPGVPDDKRGITIHHLLTHSSGLESDFAGDYEAVERDDYVKRVLGSKLRSKPGEGYNYSNAGYSLLGAIVEIVSAQSYETYLRTNLFLPAGMKETGYKLPQWDNSRIAVGYQAGKRWGKSTEKPWAKDGPYWALRANGGILSTVDDMYRWDRALRGDSILSTAAKEKMYTRHIREGGQDSWYGYGWAVSDAASGGRLIAHNGGNGVFYFDFLRFVDEDLVVILATNDSTIRGGRTAGSLARIAHGENVPVPSATATKLRPLGTEGRDAVMRGWIDAFNADGFDAMRAFRAKHASPKPGPTDDERQRRWMTMRQDLGTLEALGVGEGGEGDGVLVKAKGTREPAVSLRFHFDPADGKLEGVGVEVGN